MIKKGQEAFPRAIVHSDNRLFRTSTTYLLDPTESCEPQKLASFAKNTQNHVSYFAKARPEEFQLDAAQIVTLEEQSYRENMIKKSPNPQKDVENQPKNNQKPQKKENKLPTPQSFAKISNVLKEAVASHKFMKQKLKQIKIQQNKEKPASPRNPPTNQKDRAFKFSLSPSPFASPRYVPHSPRSPHSQRYPVKGSMTERYNKQKAELTELVQQYKMMKASRDFQQCTFQPSLVAKARNHRILTERQQALRIQQNRKPQDLQDEGVFIKFQRRGQFQTAKKAPFKFDDFRNLIKFELARIQFQKQ